MKNIRHHFPILQRRIQGKPLIYFDNAATTHKPQAVLDAVNDFYLQHNGPTHRAIYALAEEATALYEQARLTVAQFINAHDAREIVFTGGTTESINLIASTWAAEHIKAGDEIVVSELEHHANLLPWQRVAQRAGALLRFIPVLPNGTLDLDALSGLITSATKLVAVSHVSNAVGTENDIARIIKVAHAVGAKVVIDAAQSAPHQIIDVQKLDADFIAFSGHKMLAPTGIGVLYCPLRMHSELSPYQLGGGMVYEANFGAFTPLPMPYLLQAGTPPIAQAIGLAAAIRYLQAWIDFDDLRIHQAQLCAQLIDGLSHHERITVVGPVEQLKQSGHLVSFYIDGIHAHDGAAYLNTHGIAVRAGHHCAQPLAKKLGLDSSIRASFYVYNTAAEVEVMLAAIKSLLFIL